MCEHYWGDRDFDWDELRRAISYIYFECGEHGMTPRMKEKYGTVRYEFINTKHALQLITFLEIIKKATEEFPTVARELVCDLYPWFDDDNRPPFIEKLIPNHWVTLGKGH